jgi:hypothetical protein
MYRFVSGDLFLYPNKIRLHSTSHNIHSDPSMIPLSFSASILLVTLFCQLMRRIDLLKIQSIDKDFPGPDNIASSVTALKVLSVLETANNDDISGCTAEALVVIFYAHLNFLIILSSSV